MWVSRRTDYATRAVLALTLADGRPLTLEEIATRTATPRSVLEQVMPVVRSAGIVRSERGGAVATGSIASRRTSPSNASSACSRASWPRSAARPATSPSRAR